MSSALRWTVTPGLRQNLPIPALQIGQRTCVPWAAFRSVMVAMRSSIRSVCVISFPFVLLLI